MKNSAIDIVFKFYLYSYCCPVLKIQPKRAVNPGQLTVTLKGHIGLENVSSSKVQEPPIIFNCFYFQSVILHVKELIESAKMVIVYVKMVSKILIMTVTVEKVEKLQIIRNCVILSLTVFTFSLWSCCVIHSPEKCFVWVKK